MHACNLQLIFPEWECLSDIFNDSSAVFILFQKALGMQSGAISDEQISASSEQSQHYAKSARLNSTAWVAGILNSTQWLQIDLGSQHKVNRVATKGKGADNMFVSKYNLTYSNDEVNFYYYKEKEGAGNKVKYNKSLR